MEKEEKIPDIKSAFARILERRERRPWYEKLWTSICMFHIICRGAASYYLLKLPKNIDGKNDIALNIKDDIEFGYDVEMIYNKIMYGIYGNEPIDKKFDHFANEGIDWKRYLQRTRVINGVKIGEWQLCPKCKGDGHLSRYNSPAVQSTMLFPICDVCKGDKILMRPIVDTSAVNKEAELMFDVKDIASGA